MAQTTKKKTVTVKDLNVVVTKLINDMVILFNRVKDMDEMVNAINDDFDTRNLVNLVTPSTSTMSRTSSLRRRARHAQA